MLLEKIIEMPDPKYPLKSKVDIDEAPTLNILLTGQGPRKDCPNILTVHVEYRSWEETELLKQYLKAHPNNKTASNNNVQLYESGDEKTFLYEFDCNTGAMNIAAVYRGSKFSDPQFRYNERLIEEWRPQNKNKRQKKKEHSNYNSVVDKAYCLMGDLRKKITEEAKKPNLKIKEKDKMIYFISALDKICSYDRESLKIK